MKPPPEPPHHPPNLEERLKILGLSGAAMSRREALRFGLFGAAGLWLGNSLVRAEGAAAGPLAPAARAAGAPVRSVIQIWLWGGPCHIDTFDPKPGAGYDYCGPLNEAVSTDVAGIRLNAALPLLAREAGRYALIRAMTHGIFAHETASYAVQTGRAPGGRDVFPGIGAVASLFKGYGAGYKGLLPPYIVLTELQGRFSEAGFLGPKYKPFATGGDPGAARFVVDGVVAPGIDESRQRARRELLHKLNTLERALRSGDPRLAAFAQCENDAYEMILGDTGKVFDLSREKAALRDRYGRNTFGQSCLMARRLAERGVPYVTIDYQGWDTHKQHFQIMRRKLPELDRGLSALLGDLADRGLLSSTVVWACGEFGRTPKVMWDPPWNGGRNHWGDAFSVLVAGGRFKGGRVVGATDARGEAVAEDPVHPCDLIAEICGQMGIRPSARLPHPEGLDIAAVPPAEADSRGPLAKIL